MAGYLEIAIAALLGAGVLLVATSMRPNQRFVAASFISVPMFFVPGLPLPLSLCWLLLIGLLNLIDRPRPRGGATQLGPPTPPKSALVQLGSLLVLVYLVAAVWSPSPSLAFHTALRMSLFVVALELAVRYGATDVTIIDRALKWMAPWLVLQGLLTIVFRLDPAIELSFLTSSRTSLIVGPAGQALLTTAQNNVLDPAKAGGLIVNGNAASLCCGLSSLAFYVLHTRTSQARWLFASVLMWISVYFTGSKTGLALAISMPLAVVAIRSVTRPDRRLGAWLFPPAVLLLALEGPAFLDRVFPSYAANSTSSIDTRDLLWSAAKSLYVQHAALGLGFGGWEQTIGQYVGRSDYPPHNMIISAWADAGTFAAIVVVCYLGATLSVSVSTSMAAREPSQRNLAATISAAMLWIFVHGMGDNTTIYAEQRSMFLVALLLGYVYSARYGDSAKNVEGDVFRPLADERRTSRVR